MPDIEIPDVLTSAPGVVAAELVVDGLSVFCFNNISAENFWEVAYPRQRQHDLTIKIQELDGDGNKVGRATSHPIDRRVEQITIRLTNGSLEHYNDFPHGGPWADDFDRDTPNDNDPHDLQWMVDLAGDEIQHGNFIGLKPRHPSRPRTIVNLRHSLFCNLEPEDLPSRIAPRSGNHPDAAGNFDLGLTNTFIVGVLLGSAPGNIEFEFSPGGLTTIDPHPHDENKLYRIDLINDDTGNPHQVGNFVRGDLRLFYDELIDVSGPEKDLWAIPDPNKEFSPDGDCHPTVFGGATLGP